MTKTSTIWVLHDSSNIKVNVGYEYSRFMLIPVIVEPFRINAKKSCHVGMLDIDNFVKLLQICVRQVYFAFFLDAFSGFLKWLC